MCIRDRSSRPQRSLTAPPTIPSGWVDAVVVPAVARNVLRMEREVLVQTMKTTVHTPRWAVLAAQSLGMEKMRETAPKEAVGCTIEPGWQNGNPGLHRNVYLHQGGICMHRKTIFALAAAAILLLVVAGASAQATLSSKEQLGKKLFFDTNLSTPPVLACAGCHGAEVGYTGQDAAINAAGAVYEGAMPGRFGNRKPPSAAYAGASPILHWDGTTWLGGMFWDGRATGWTLGDPLAEQAQGPFLNPLEQNNASALVVTNKVLASSYRELFLGVCTERKKYYDCIGRAIAAYERSKEV